MTTEAKKFRIGLFVTIGVCIAVGAMIALGTSRFFTDTKTYVTYFDESVQGLEKDSLVKYRGIPVGRVYKLRIAPDDNLAEVILKIGAEVKIDPDMFLQMSYAGITGMKYLEIEPGKPGEAVEGPKLSFPPPYPVIQSKPSDLQAILTSIEKVVQNLKELDLKGIGEKIKESLDDTRSLLSRENWSQTLKNVEATSASLKEGAKRIEEMLHKPGVQDALADAAETVSSLKEVTAKIQKELDQMDLDQMITTSTQKINRFFDQATLTAADLRFILTQQEGNIFEILDNLRMTSESLNNLAASIKADPGMILFSKPPEPEP